MEIISKIYLSISLAKAILSGESSSKDIQMNSIKNFGNDRDFDAFELYYQSMLDERANKFSSYDIKVFDKVLYKGEEVYVELSNDGNKIICDKVNGYKIEPLEDIINKIEDHFPQTLEQKFKNYGEEYLKIARLAEELIINRKSGIAQNDNISFENESGDENVLISMESIKDVLEKEDVFMLYDTLKAIIDRAKTIKTELVENAIQNEKDGLSVHDGHGGNWGSDLADLFGIASQSSNVSICSMKEEEREDYGFKEGDTVLVYDESAVFKTSPANGQLYAELEDRKVFLNSYTSTKFSLDLSKIETPAQETPSFVAYVGKGKKQRKVEVKASNNLFDAMPDEIKGAQLAFNF